MRIATLENLREHLQWAIELEHFLLPPYMCALYSLDPDRNPEATEVVASVLVEEMLHMALAANLLNAVDGRPRLDSPQMLTGYPRCLPHGDRSFEVPLVRFGPEALELFLKIEQPAASGAPPESDCYETIGQFHDAIRHGLRELCAHLGEVNVFCGDPARQLTGGVIPGGSGRIIAIDSLATALAALEEIVEQGEGAARTEVWDGDRDIFHPEREQVAHYWASSTPPRCDERDRSKEAARELHDGGIAERDRRGQADVGDAERVDERAGSSCAARVSRRACRAISSTGSPVCPTSRC